MAYKANIKYDSGAEPNEPAKLELVATPALEKRLEDIFDLEVEMLQATREEMPGGKTKLTILVYDQDKINYIRRFVMRMITFTIPNNSSN